MTKPTLQAIEKGIPMRPFIRRLKAAVVWMLMLSLVWNSTVLPVAEGATRDRRSSKTSSKPARRAASSALAQGQTIVVWGPQQVVRQPINTTYNAQFSLPSGAVPPYQMTVSNGALGGTNKVTSACIQLNGVNVLAPACNHSVNPSPQIRTVSLQAANTINVTLVGAVNSFITITISGNQADLNAPLPAQASQGQMLNVTLSGNGTNWVTGQTQAFFGGEIAVGGSGYGSFGPINVISPTSATATITVLPTAALGPRTIIISNGAENVTAANAFTITANPTPGASSSSVSTLAGSASMPGYVNAAGPQARFRSPVGIAVGQGDVVYVADAGNHAIRRAEPDGTVTTLAGNGEPGFVDGQGESAAFNNPQGVAVDANGNVYVADTGNHAIRRIDALGNVTTLAGDGAPGYINGLLATARFDGPRGVAVNSIGRVYVADTGNSTLRAIELNGQVVTVAGDGTVGANDSPNARFNGITGVAIESRQVYVYLADGNNHRIRRISGSGEVITLAGVDRGFKDGLATESRFADPVGIAADGAGHLVIAEMTNSLIREVDPELALSSQPNAVSTLAGTGQHGATDGTGDIAQFAAPQGVGVTSYGALIVADTGNHTLRRILLPPAIALLKPAEAAPGETIDIIGNRFDARAPQNNTVLFTAVSGGTTVGTVSAVSRARLSVIVPADAGTGPLKLQTTGGTAISPENFTLSGGMFISSFTPTSGPAGTVVTIYGNEFVERGRPAWVTFKGPIVNGMETTLVAELISATSNQIVAIVPNGAVTGVVEVTTPADSVRTSIPFTVTTNQDFGLTLAPSSLTVVQGSTANFVVRATSPQTTFTQLISLTATGLPAGATATLNPSQITAGATATMSLKLSPSLAPTSYSFTVQGTAMVDGSDLVRTAGGSFTVMASGSTTLAGRVLSTEGVPIPGCTVSAPAPSGPDATATTDGAGNFLLIGLQAGPARPIFIQPPANTVYPRIKEPADVTANQSNTVPYIFYLPAIDPLNTPINPNGDTVVGSTRPGLEKLQMTIPLNVSLRTLDANNNPIGTVTHVSITPVPVDRTPAPLPAGTRPTMVFTSQPGNACVWNAAANQCFTDDTGPKMPVVYPNLSGANPGAQIPLWAFNHNTVQWYQYGTGTVSADGKTITPNAGAGLRDFSWHFPSPSSADGNPGDPSDCNKNRGPNTVDYSTGIKIETVTDLFISGGRGGLELTHTFTTDQGLSYGGLAGLSNVYRFGVGTRDNYDIRLIGSFTSSSAGYLVLPEQTPFRLADNNVFTPLNGGRLFSYDSILSASGVSTFTNSTTTSLLSDTIRRIDAQTLEYRSIRGYIMRFEPNFNYGNSNNDTYYRLKSIIDRNGNITTLSYAGGNLTQVTDPVGRTLTFTYASPNCSKCVSQVVAAKAGDPMQRIVTYTYNSQQQLTDVTDQLGQAYNYTYEVASLGAYTQTRLKTVVDRRHNTIKSLAYDANGRVISQTFPDGGTERYNYTLSGNIVTGITIIDPLGRAMSKRFNAAGYVIEEVDELGQGAVITRAIGSNTATQTTGPCGCPEAVRTYDERGRVTTIKDRVLKEIKLKYIEVPLATDYDPLRARPILYTDQLGRVLTLAYDSGVPNSLLPRGNIISATNDLNQTTNYTFDSFGRLTAITDALNHATTYGYDANGYITSHTDALSHTTTFQYDLVGNLLLVTDALGRQSRMRYDTLDRVINVRKPVNDPLNETGNPTYSYTYDENDNRLSITDANLKTWTFTYDTKNNLLTAKRPLTDPKDKPYRLEYDVADQLVKTITPAGRTMRYAYDARGQKQAITDGLGNVINFVYDNRGNLTTVKDQRNNTLTFSYDELFRLIGRRDPLGRQVTMEYDPVGNVIAQTDRLGRRTAIAYDNLYRPTTITYADATVNYQYDAASRLTSVGDVNGAITWQYDNANRITSETTPLGVISYSYNNANQRSSMTAANRLPVSYGYDSFGRLQTITQGSETFTYGYDALSRRTSLQRPNNVTTTYQYDEISRLKRLTHANATTTLEDLQYEFNLDNEISQVTSLASAPAAAPSKTATMADAANRIGQFGTANYSFNQEGQTTAKTDASGTTGYQWDARGRLTRATLPSGQTVDYGYDATGRRTSSSTNGLTTTYQYDGMEVVIDRSNGAAVDYLNGPGIDDKLRQSDSTWGTMYFLRDHLGSTLGLTNTSGGLVEALQQYDAFGGSAGSARTRYGFTGRELDAATGLIHYRARWYDSQQGRFLSEDPLGLAGGDSNLYAYVYNSPTNLFDPLGLEGWGRGEWGEFGGGAVESAIVGAGIGLALVALAPFFPIAIPLIGQTLVIIGALDLISAALRWHQMCEMERARFLGGLVGGFLGGRLGGRLGSRFGRRASGNYCFVAGTKVQTPEGEKNIEDIKVGDEVLSSDPEQGENGGTVSVQKVVQVFERTATEVVDIRVGGETITATLEHPFWVVGRGWIAAGQLESDSPVMTKDGRVVRVSSIKRCEGDFKVYNFEVNDLHTYLVGKLGILAHNSCNIDPRKLNHEFKHAPDFGVNGNWNKPNAKAFEQAIQDHVANAPYQSQGTYRGTQSVTHYFDSATDLWVSVDPSGNFVAGWRLSPAQRWNLILNGNVQ